MDLSLAFELDWVDNMADYASDSFELARLRAQHTQPDVPEILRRSLRPISTVSSITAPSSGVFSGFGLGITAGLNSSASSLPSLLTPAGSDSLAKPTAIKKRNDGSYSLTHSPCGVNGDVESMWCEYAFDYGCIDDATEDEIMDATLKRLDGTIRDQDVLPGEFECWLGQGYSLLAKRCGGIQPQDVPARRPGAVEVLEELLLLPTAPAPSFFRKLLARCK